jgi:hypothetical protein
MRRTLPLLLALLLAVYATPAAAATSPDPLASGSTTLTVAAPFKRLLVSHGVTLTATAPASARSNSYSLPLAAGTVDPTVSRLSLQSSGALVFARGHRRVILRRLGLKTAHVPLIAKVGGGQLKLASAAQRRFSRPGFASALRATGLRLTAKFATRLSKKLALHGVFVQGQLLGNVSALVAPATVTVQPTGSLGLILDTAFVAKLNSLFVSLNPVAPAERFSPTYFTVPFIPAGTIAPDGTSGVPRTGGSLEFLQLGAGQIIWHELWFDLAAGNVLAEVDEEPTPTFPGKLGQLPIAILAAGAVSSDPRIRTVSISGAPLTLGAQMAAAFNEAFAKPQGKSDIFQTGEPLGMISFTAQTR